MIRTPQQLALFPVPLYCKAGRRPGPAGRCPAGRRPGPAGRYPAGRRPGNKSCRKVQRQVSGTPLSYPERAYMFDGIDDTEILKSIVIGDQAQGTNLN